MGPAPGATNAISPGGRLYQVDSLWRLAPALVPIAVLNLGLPHAHAPGTAVMGVLGQARTQVEPFACCHSFSLLLTPRHMPCPCSCDHWGPGKNPNWNQTLRFALANPPYVLELEVWDDDPGRDDFMAKGVVDFKTAVDYGQHSGSFPLRGKHGE